MKNKKDKIKRATKVFLVEAMVFLIIVGAILFLTPKIIGVNQEDKLTFFKFTNAYAILIDDNPEFSSPEKINEKTTKLGPGEYYWRAVGLFGESETGNFSIDSEVVISMDVDEGTTLKNKGNVPARVVESSGGIITGNMIIEINEEREFSNQSSFEVRQND
jgi:hypothetical protein